MTSSLVKPSIFILGLDLAGIFCVILLMLLPALLAWRGRYIKKTASGYQVWGGKALVLLQIIVSAGLLIFGVM